MNYCIFANQFFYTFFFMQINDIMIKDDKYGTFFYLFVAFKTLLSTILNNGFIKNLNFFKNFNRIRDVYENHPEVLFLP